MKGKIGRGFLFYLFLLLGIVLGAFIICVVVMIFVPDFSLFGLRAFNENYKNRRHDKMSVYSSMDAEPNSDLVAISSSEYSIKNIEIDANVHSVRVIKSNINQGVNYNQFVAVFNNSSIGFTTKKVEKTTITIRFYIDTETLKIEIKSPEGFVNFGGNSSVFLQIPPSYALNDVNLVINSGKSVVIGDELYAENPTPSILNFKSVKIKANKSIYISKYATIGESETDDCLLSSKSGNITVSNTIKAKNLTMEASESTIRMNEDAQAFNISGDFNLTTKNAFVHLGNFNANRSILKNRYGKMYFKAVNSDIIIDKESYKCDYKFKTINGEISMGSYFDNYLIDKSNIFVEESIVGTVMLATTGNIDIKDILGSVSIKNTSGKINIEKVSGFIDISSQNSNINIGTENTRVASRMNIFNTGSGKIVVYIGNIQYVESKAGLIKSNKGEIEVNVRENTPFNLKIASEKGIEYFDEEMEEKEIVVQRLNAKLLVIESKSMIRVVSK